MVTGDFNKDGHADYVVANGYTSDLWMYFGKGDGTFELPRIIPLTKGLSPVYVVTADLRGNGTLDLIVAESDTSTIGVLLGHGDGTFGFEQTYSLPQPPAALVVDDFDHDGKLDIASVMFTVSSDTRGVQYLATLLGTGNGSFGAPVISMNPGFYSTAWNIASGDVNGDGRPDVIITGPGIENSQVYINAGAGKFVPGQLLVGNSAVNLVLDGRFADVNEDGCLDAIVADINGYVWVLTGDCSGNFASPSIVRNGDSNSALRLVDLNGDGHLDIATSAIAGGDPTVGDIAGDTLSVALGDGRGHFTSGRDYVGTGQSYSLAIADFNGDGKPDVVTSNIDTDTASVYINDGSGGFGFPQGEFIGLNGVGVLNSPVSPPSFTDLNGDGKPDVLILDEGYSGEYFAAAMLNDGTGRFSSPVTTDLGISIVGNWLGDYRLGDFRHTGHLDFVGIGLTLGATTGSQFIFFMPGNGDGTFGNSTIIPTSGADGEMAVGDFNGDGKLDLVAVAPTANLSSKAVTTFLGNGNGTFHNGGTVSFSDSAEEIARAVAGDFNRDGKLDILVYDTGNGYWTTSSYVWEFLGNGDGTFQTGRQLFTAFQPLALADVNGDHWLDIARYDFFWPDGTTTTLGPPKFTTYLGQPDGSFRVSNTATPYGGMPIEVAPYLQSGDPAAVSLVADLNGDGKTDEIAWQRISQSNGAAYAQILMGNGDGTFTPTYDVFALNKDYFYPKYGHDVDGDGRTDLLEVDSFTSSMELFKSAPAPSLQLVLEEEQAAGGSGCGWVFPNVPNASDRAVTLSSSVSGVNLPLSVTIPSGSLGQRFCYTLDSNYDWRQVFDVRAQLGSDVAVAYASDSYVVGFSETLFPSAEQVIYPGQSTTPVTIQLTSSQGYSSTAHLRCEGLQPGETCTFGSSALTVSSSGVANTTLVVHTSNGNSGRGPITIVADDGNVAPRQAFILTVQPLTLSTVGDLQSTSPGTATGGVFILGIPPYSPSCSGLPAQVTCSFSGTQQPYPSNTGLNINVTTSAGLAVGTYPFSVQVVSGPATAFTSSTLTIVDFSVQAPSPASDWAPPGGTVNISVGVQPLNHFNGVVNLTCSTDFSRACSGSSVGVGGNSPLPAGLSVSVPSNATAGVHTLMVSATYGALTHTYSFPFYVADYSGSVSTSSLSLARGGSTAVSATVNVTTGFAGTVSFTCTGTSAVTCDFTPATVQPAPGTPATENIRVTASFAASKIPHGRETRGELLALGMPFLIIVGIACGWGKRTPARRNALFVIAIMVAFASSSCGGGTGSTGGSGGGGSGSNNYTIAVNAVAAGTGTIRTVGTLNVTVTH